MTIKVWPSGCVCQAVRAPGSNVTLTLLTRAGSGAWNSGSWRTTPVKYSAGALRDGCEPLRLISIAPFLPAGLQTASSLDHPDDALNFAVNLAVANGLAPPVMIMKSIYGFKTR